MKVKVRDILLQGGRKSITLLECFQVSPAPPSDKSGMKVKVLEVVVWATGRGVIIFWISVELRNLKKTIWWSLQRWCLISINLNWEGCMKSTQKQLEYWKQFQHLLNGGEKQQQQIVGTGDRRTYRMYIIGCLYCWRHWLQGAVNSLMNYKHINYELLVNDQYY